MEYENSPFKVVIVGGGITGLTLAHCLDRAGVDYVLLEKHIDICANIGGAIAVEPNGTQILDQLGFYHDFKKKAHELRGWYYRYPGGNLTESLWPAMLKERFGYPVVSIARSDLLRVLSTSLQGDERIKLGVTVTVIDQPQPNGPLSVTTSDGTKYTGDIVVGADGVHSMTRAEMWRMANLQRPGLITEQDKKAIKVDYMGIFGLAKIPPEILQLEDSIVHRHKKWTLMVMPCYEGTVTWILSLRLDQPYFWPSVPRWSMDEAKAQVIAKADALAWGDVCLRDLWKYTAEPGVTPLYEGQLKTWSVGRIACVGDSVFKTTPNLGLGANLSIESAATIANTLRQLSHSTTKLTDAQVDAELNQYQKLLWDRFATVDWISQMITRRDAVDSIRCLITGFIMVKLPIDLAYTSAVDVIKVASLLHYLPLPDRARQALVKHAAKKRGWGSIRVLALCATVPALFLFLRFKYH
ncbi:FAD binding domain protein [Talaromyces islandicus]|uniref:FAD binding domain protein n=1 Tax=Talaromyces islandicus TaxID=28573 RepID=A0A0U1LVS8_TALIS|nr:FAD binding domain protein [Talaromyces islandicus]